MAVSLETISEKVELAKAYHIQLTDYDYSQRIAGYCTQYQERITCLGRLIMALGWDIAGEYNTDVTQRLYALLLTQISTYSGATLPIDPNVVIPGQTIIVEQSYTTPVKLPFTNATEVEIADWQASYADTYGNFPSLTIYLYNGTSGSYSEFSGATETLQYDGTNTLLQTVTFDFGGIELTGYLLIGVA